MHFRDHLEESLGADRAVRAHDLDALGCEVPDDSVRRLAGDGETVLTERHHGHDRQVGGFPDGADRGVHLPEVADGFDEEKVDTGFEECLDLLAEREEGIFDRKRADRLQPATCRADRTGDEDRPAADLPFLAGDLDSAEIDVAYLVGEAVLLEAIAVGAEGVGFDKVRARVDVGAMDLGNLLGIREVQLIEAGVGRVTEIEEHRAHGAIAEDDAGVEAFRERVRHVGFLRS